MRSFIPQGVSDLSRRRTAFARSSALLFQRMPYLRFWVKSEDFSETAERYLRDDGMIKVSRSLKERSREAVKLSEKLTKENGREPTVTELSKILGIDCFAVSELLNISLPPVSLTASDDDNERQTDVPVPSGEDAIQDKLALEEVLKALPQKDQTLIRLRYFKGFTQSATAEKLGMSQVQVSRKERAVLAIMRKKLTDDYSQSAT